MFHKPTDQRAHVSDEIFKFGVLDLSFLLLSAHQQVTLKRTTKRLRMKKGRREFSCKFEIETELLNQALYDEDLDSSLLFDDVSNCEAERCGQTCLARPQQLLNFEDLLSFITESPKPAPKRKRSARLTSKKARRLTLKVNHSTKTSREMPSRPRLIRSESCPSPRYVPPIHPSRDDNLWLGQKWESSRLTCTPRENIGVHAIQSLVPHPVVPSILGPALRASLIVTSSAKRAAALLIWSIDNLTVVPLVGCGESLDESWQYANLMESTILTRMSVFSEANQTSLAKYWSMTCNLASRLAELVDILENLVPNKRRLDNQPNLVTNSLRSLKVDIGQSFEHFEILTSWQQVHEKEPAAAFALSEENPSELGEGICLVCFETIIPTEESMSYLLQCGHVTCLDCYRDYLHVVSESGQGSFVCPAFKCSTRISFIDSAHILFGSAQPPRVTSQKEFSKLVHFELERHGTCDIKGRFCPSPGCGRLLVPGTPTTRSLKDGWSICYCLCGHNICAECPMGGPAHPGLSCSTQSRLQQSMSSGKVEDDTAR